MKELPETEVQTSTEAEVFFLYFTRFTQQIKVVLHHGAFV